MTVISIFILIEYHSFIVLRIKFFKFEIIILQTINNFYISLFSIIAFSREEVHASENVMSIIYIKVEWYYESVIAIKIVIFVRLFPFSKENCFWANEKEEYFLNWHCEFSIFSHWKLLVLLCIPLRIMGGYKLVLWRGLEY